MDAATYPKLTDSQRQERVSNRARELMLSGGMGEYLDGRGPAWTDVQIKLRDEAFAQAQAETDAEYGAPSWSPDGAETDIDWSAEPRDGLRVALRERDSAVRVRDAAAGVVERALQRKANCEAELREYTDLDQQIDEFYATALRQNTSDDLPYALASASRDRQVASDRHDHATKALKTLESELRIAERELQRRQRTCHLWATRALILHAETIAVELAEVQERADALRDVLTGLSYTAFPSNAGATPITNNILRVLNAEPRSKEVDYQKLEPFRQRWLTAHAGLMHDPDLELGP
jgi:hypothetical protein